MKRRILAGLLSVFICLGAVATVSAAATGKTESVSVSDVSSVETESVSVSDVSSVETESASVSDVSSVETEAASASDASSGESETPQVSAMSEDGDENYILHLTNPETGEEIGTFDLGPLNLWGQDVVDLIRDINKRLATVDPDELAANLMAVNATLRSEEFAHLWDYDAFQNLVIEALASILDFAKEDGELSVKILTKLGLSGQISEILIDCIQASKVTGDDIRKIPPERIYEGIQQILDMMDKLTGSDMFSNLLEINDNLESGIGGDT